MERLGQCISGYRRAANSATISRGSPVKPPIALATWRCTDDRGACTSEACRSRLRRSSAGPRWRRHQDSTRLASQKIGLSIYEVRCSTSVCASLQISRSRLAKLRRETGAIAICGYTHSVDWFEAAGVEIILLSALAAATSRERQRVPDAIRRLWQRSGTLMGVLGFVSEPDYRPPGSRR